MHSSTVAIVGLGMMGSSLGLALEGTGATRLGVDADPATAESARSLGAVDGVDELESIVPRADIVVLATPVLASIELAPRVAPLLRDGAVLTDLGSTKRAICATFDELDVRAIGGHPMCGSEHSGPSAARGDLFRGATWAVCARPDDSSTEGRRVAELVGATGATLLLVDPAEHDRAVATASHLPYVTATALVGALAVADEETDGLATTLAASGFRGATRLASGDSVMWGDILATNGDYVRDAIGVLRRELDAIEARLPER